MVCPSCSGTMQMVVLVPGPRVYHCERCGSMRRVFTGERVEDVMPKLVERCRTFAGELSDEPGLMARWEALGIAESIDPPEDRG